MKKNKLLKHSPIQKDTFKNRMFKFSFALSFASLLSVQAAESEVAADEGTVSNNGVATMVAQQTKSIKGTVVDALGEPLIGANVIVKNTTNGTITDMDGKFTLNIPKNATLVISYIGYTEVEVSTAGKTTFNIVLKDDSELLEELVVVGYGVQKKSDVTGSVVSVKEEKLTERAVTSAAQALQGHVPGVNITQSSAKPGADPKVRIRGNRSLTATNDPLYVVDGIPITAGLSAISPSDIQSMEVLKDASATAIYGSRGANGVIIITTKKGKAGKVQIDYNGYYGVQEAANPIEMLNGAEWVEFLREASRATKKGVPYPMTPTLDADRTIGYFIGAPDVWSKIEGGYDESGAWHPERVPYTDWSALALQSAPIQNHEISVRGGTEKLKTLFSVTYFDQDGVVKGQDYNRYSIRLNLDWDLNDYIKIGTQTMFSHANKQDGPNIYSEAKFNFPLADPYNEDGSLKVERPGNDPLRWNSLLNVDNVEKERITNRFLGSYYLEVKLPWDVKFRSNFGLDYTANKDRDFFGVLSSAQAGSQAKASYGGNDRMMYTWENLLFWNKTFNSDHRIGATFLQSIQEETVETFNINVKDLPYESQKWNNVGSAGSITGVSSNYVKWRLASFMARVNYNFKERYLLTASARYDGASRLATGNKWSVFPSAAFAWRVKEESFLKEVDALSNLKLRLGWGITGNSAISPYKTLGSLAYSRYTYGGNNVMTFYPKEMPNPELGWERTEQWNLGADFGFANGRINGSIDVYKQTTHDLLMNRQLPVVSGFEAVTSNIGKIGNKGIEIALNTINVDSKNFSWTTDLMFTTNKEEILELYNGTNDDVGNKWFIGQPVKVFYDHEFGGIWQLDEKAEMAKFSGSALNPGNIKVVDQDGDYSITSADRVILGQEEPKYLISMNNYFSYKNFDLNFLFNGSFGNMIRFDRDVHLTGRSNGAKVNYWRATAVDAEGNITASNESQEYPRPNKDFEGQPYEGTMDYHDASYVRLSNISLGYTLPANLCKKFLANRLRVYATVQNAFLITSFPGSDPESGSGFNEPMPRSYLLGLNLSF